jgi:hypothetical protein
VGLSVRGNDCLERLKEQKVFVQGRDGYKLAIALATINDLKPSDPIPNRINKYHAHSLDPDGELIEFISLRRPELKLPPYRLLQGLADAGIIWLYEQREKGQDPLSGQKLGEAAETS